MNQSYYDQIILSVANALMLGSSIDEIYQELADRNWNKEEIYLLITAGKILYLDRIKINRKVI